MSSSENIEEASPEIFDKFKEILHQNGIIEEIEKVIITEPPELKGEHMATATVYVNVQFKDISIQPKNLFMKRFTTSVAHTSMIKKMRVMEKESVFFTKFLPELREFCKKYENCSNLLDFFPKCLYGDEEMIVLENLVLNDGFIMLCKEEKQDLFTAKYVLSNLAKFHAANYAFIENVGREEFTGRDGKWELVAAEGFMFSMMGAMFDNGVSICVNLLKGHPVEGSQEALETLMGFLGNTFKLMSKALKPHNEEVEKLTVINHGDCWNNNMLFKKDLQSGKINNHVFVDLQLTRLVSPNVDIGYFLYTSVKPDIRRLHLMELLQHYLQTFENTLEAFNMKVPISFEEFFEDYKVKSQFGFYINLSVLSALAAMKDFDVEDMTEDKEKMMEIFTQLIEKWIKNNPEAAEEISKEIVNVVREWKGLLPNED